jgi:hypothetical protein
MARAGFQKPYVMAGLDVARSRQADHRGAGRTPCHDASDAVLDLHAVRAIFRPGPAFQSQRPRTWKTRECEI